MKNHSHKQKILIVEDEMAILRILTEKLQREGFITMEATDGEMGLAMALAERPDMILLDFLMPKMDGLTLLKNLRARGAYGKKVPVILLTNVSPESEQLDLSAIDDAATSYFLKTNLTLQGIIEKVKERLPRN